MDKESQLIWESYVDNHPGYNDTKWSDGNITITIQDVEDMLDKLSVEVEEIPVDKIKHIDIHARHEPNKSPEEVKSTRERANRSDLSYPIIVTRDTNGQLKRVLDGNHRLHKATIDNEPSIKAKVLDLSTVPEEWLNVFE